jgi:hypothetical protein
VEYLWVPCSFLQPQGAQYLEVTADGVAAVVPVRINSNLKAATVEDLVGQKRAGHLSAFACLRDELRGDLERLAGERGGAARWGRDSSRGYMPLEDFLASIVAQVLVRPHGGGASGRAGERVVP